MIAVSFDLKTRDEKEAAHDELQESHNKQDKDNTNASKTGHGLHKLC